MTPVIFKKFPEGDVIAIFPEDWQGIGTRQSYQAKGQHAPCSVALITELPDAMPDDYTELQNEMESHGAYELYILKSEAQLRTEYGFWGSHPEYPVEDWKYEVNNGDTRRGYWQWVEAMIEMNCP